jgi:hypothetical protein
MPLATPAKVQDAKIVIGTGDHNRDRGRERHHHHHHSNRDHVKAIIRWTMPRSRP